MVVIRLARGGSKKNPFYHVVVADKRARRDGRCIERVGYFNPMARGMAKRLELEAARIEHWLKTGAQPSERVKSLLKEAKANEGKEFTPAPTKAEMKKQQAAEAEKAAKARALKEKAEADAAAKAEAEEAKAAAAEEETKEEAPAEEAKSEEG